MLRTLTWVVSLALHGGLLWYALADLEGHAYALGSGDDEFVIEQGVTIEGVALMGTETETVQAVEVEPVMLSEARPEIKEVKPEEEKTEVISSEHGPEQEMTVEEVKEVVDPRKEQVATVEQVPQVPVEEKLAASDAQEGGRTSVLKAYEGQMHAHLMKKVVRPRGSERVGKVVVRFVINPKGEVVSREVAQSSGVANIDAAALASIDRASPFPPVPAEIASGPMVHTVPFKFSVR